MLLSDLLPATIAWQPAERDVVLLAGTREDLPVIETVLATLPAKARGRVFVEVETDAEVGELAAPGRVCVTWLVRQRGQELRRSVDAWVSEMLPVSFDREHRLYAWIAGSGTAHALTSD
ncbi:SIP domain-containing protein [Homoserinibacter sp. YIM 151385]|uniref:SIP domain-containing protein n=1 Tax=Homoserinibacter sp. YIM 151385 TaxID=2985506 RepID=UPI0022F068BA|nr:SIP domain-containing protein [Homoserinibacter sp. YIM 151385]WBU38258.1 SIP domain-containing protein [Homoserinibacter sp. YIM 151385]